MTPAVRKATRRAPGRPRAEESPASLDEIFQVSLRAFATLGYDGVSLRTLNRELGGSHNLLNGRFGSKEALWYATVDWAFAPLAQRVASAFDPTLTDPLEQVRIFIRVFLLYSADHPELVGLMNIEGQRDTERLAYVFDNYIAPAMEPMRRLLDHLVAEGRIHPVPLSTFHFILTHGAGGPFTLEPLARHFSQLDPRGDVTPQEQAELSADFIVRGLRADAVEPKAAAPRGRRQQRS
jgi:AcrR family transcriptional regulator|nr:TetR/AcrR family transcriptional regulator [Mycobacterium sp. URHB0044]